MTSDNSPHKGSQVTATYFGVTIASRRPRCCIITYLKIQPPVSTPKKNFLTRKMKKTSLQSDVYDFANAP